MKTSRAALWMAPVGLAAAAVLAVVPSADAGARAKAKCRVRENPAKVQIAAGADGLAPGFATFQANVVDVNGNVVRSSDPIPNVKVDALGDAAAEWDSAIAAG